MGIINKVDVKKGIAGTIFIIVFVLFLMAYFPQISIPILNFTFALIPVYIQYKLRAIFMSVLFFFIEMVYIGLIYYIIKYTIKLFSYLRSIKDFLSKIVTKIVNNFRI